MGSTFRPIEYESMYTSRFIEDCFEVFKHAWNSVYFKPIPIWQNFSSTLLLSIYVLELIDNKSFLHHFKQEIKILTINYFFFFFVHKCTTGNKCNNFIKILHEVHKVQLLQTDQGDNSGTLWWHDPYSICDFFVGTSCTSWYTAVIRLTLWTFTPGYCRDLCENNFTNN